MKLRYRGYEYNPDEGDSQRGIPAGTAFGDLPDNWKCPICALAGKGEFRDQVVQKKDAVFQAEVYIARGKVYQKLGDNEKASQDFQTTGTLDAIRRAEIESLLAML